MAATLHQRLLGASFERLPAVLRAFHECERGGCASGRFELVRGRGWLRSWAAWAMRLAPQGNDVPTHLDVVVEGERERWVRRFGSHSMVTIQQIQHGLLAEDFGHMRFMFDLSADENGMRFVLRRVNLLGVPLPLWLAPRVSATVTGEPHGWHIDAQIGVLLLGTLLRYRGSLRPEGAPDATAESEDQPEEPEH